MGDCLGGGALTPFASRLAVIEEGQRRASERQQRDERIRKCIAQNPDMTFADVAERMGVSVGCVQRAVRP